MKKQEIKNLLIKCLVDEDIFEEEALQLIFETESDVFKIWVRVPTSAKAEGIIYSKRTDATSTRKRKDATSTRTDANWTRN